MTERSLCTKNKHVDPRRIGHLEACLRTVDNVDPDYNTNIITVKYPCIPTIKC